MFFYQGGAGKRRFALVRWGCAGNNTRDGGRLMLAEVRPNKVLMALCSFRLVDPEMCMSLISVLMTGRQHIYNLRIMKGMYVDQSRNLLVKEAVKDGASHILFLDDDMTWPADLLSRLLAHNLPIVGGQYFRRYEPYDTACGTWDDASSTSITPLRSLPTGVAEVGCLGMGATLIRMEVIQKMAAWFNDELWFRSDTIGEDVHFCARARQLGIPVCVDGSLVCGHFVNSQIVAGHWEHYHREQNPWTLPAPTPAQALAEASK